MAARLDCFGLSELAAKPDDAVRLASLAMAEGRRVPGYGGDYYYDWVGDAAVIVRSRLDPESGEEVLLGVDTHAATDCVWECKAVKVVTEPDAGPLSQRVLVQKDGCASMAVVDLVCADVLPDIREGDTLRLGMVGFPVRISYDEGDSSGVLEAQQDTVLLEGTVLDAKIGETFFGMEPLTKFVSVTVETPMGNIELCHAMDLVPEAQKDFVKPGSVVSALCHLSGDCAVGAYAAGVVLDEAHDFAVLAAFFRKGGVERLRPVLRSDCACTFLENRQEELENALSLLAAVREDLAEAGYTECTAGTITSEGSRGRKCLLIGNQNGFAFLCWLELDSLGRVREVSITNDPDVEFEVAGRDFC